MQYREIDILKGTLPLLVVLIHCNFLDNVEVDAESLSGYICFWKILFTSLLSLAVPAFFFISGCLFFRNANQSLPDFRRKMQRRVKTLLVPYLIWNLIGLALMAVKLSPMLHQYFPRYSPADLSASHILTGFWALSHSSYPYDMPLWFIRNLIVVQCFAYPIGMLVRTMKAYALVFTACAAIALDLLWPEANGYGLVSSFFFFIFGAVAAGHMDILFRPKPRLCIWIPVYLATVCLYFAYDITAAYYLKTIMGIAVLCMIASRVSAKGVTIPVLLSKSAFFVYAFHGLFVTVTQKAVTGVITPCSTPYAVLDYAIIFSILYFVSLAAYAAMSKAFPSLTKTICGGR